MFIFLIARNKQIVYVLGMKLIEYLTETAISDDDFAKSIDVTVQAVSNYKLGKRIPRPVVMQRIVKVTNQKVTPNDFHIFNPVPAEQRSV